MLTPASFKTRFPEFATESDVRVQGFIDDADPFFDPSRWETLLDIGMAYYVAHELFTANQRMAPGGAAVAGSSDVLTKKVGEVSVTRDSQLLNSQAKDPYMRTIYGQKYKHYIKILGIGAIAV